MIVDKVNRLGYSACEDRTLIPHVRMGVEAREQILTPKGLEDAPVTVPTHPLKKFAEALSRSPNAEL